MRFTKIDILSINVLLNLFLYEVCIIIIISSLHLYFNFTLPKTHVKDMI